MTLPPPRWTTRLGRAARRPRRTVAEKSRESRIRFEAGSIGRSRTRPGQAESSSRPLRRRAARMARPARVRMRSRKPWVFARRRLFGWNVRLLTENSTRGWPGPGAERGRLHTTVVANIGGGSIAAVRRTRTRANHAGRCQASTRYGSARHRVNSTGLHQDRGRVARTSPLPRRCRPPGSTQGPMLIHRSTAYLHAE